MPRQLVSVAIMLFGIAASAFLCIAFLSALNGGSVVTSPARATVPLWSAPLVDLGAGVGPSPDAPAPAHAARQFAVLAETLQQSDDSLVTEELQDGYYSTTFTPLITG